MNLYNPPAGTIRASLRYPAFRWLLSGLAVSQTGDWLYNLALVTMVYEGTHSAMWVGGYDADVLVVALGADLAPGATPGLDECGHEFYSPDGAARVRDLLPAFRRSKGPRTNAASPPFAEIAGSVQDPAQACQMARPPILRPPREESHDHNPA